MNAVVASLIAVAGTLLGSFSTYRFQQTVTERAETSRRLEQVRQDRLAACTGFAAAVTDFRRAMIAVWYRERRRDRVFADQDRMPADRERALAEYRTAYSESDRIGAAALSAKFRMLLLLDDPVLRELAEVAFHQIDDLRSASGKGEVRDLDLKFESHMSAFVAAAALLLN